MSSPSLSVASVCSGIAAEADAAKARVAELDEKVLFFVQLCHQIRDYKDIIAGRGEGATMEEQDEARENLEVCKIEVKEAFDDLRAVAGTAEEGGSDAEA